MSRGSSSSEIPHLAGQQRTYLANQLKAFRSGERKNPLMQAIAAQLSADDIEALAIYWSRQPASGQARADAVGPPTHPPQRMQTTSAGSSAALPSEMRLPADFPAGFTAYDQALAESLRLAGPPLTSPLSSRPCAGYHATVESGDGRKRVIGSEARFSDFVLEDDSGRVLVEMEAANVDVTMDLAWRSETLDAEARFDLEQFLTSVVNPEQLDQSLREKLVYREGALCPGEQVTVVGVIAWERPSLSEPYRTHAPVRRIRGQEGGQLLVSDRLHFS